MGRSEAWEAVAEISIRLPVSRVVTKMAAPVGPEDPSEHSCRFSIFLVALELEQSLESLEGRAEGFPSLMDSAVLCDEMDAMSEAIALLRESFVG